MKTESEIQQLIQIEAARYGTILLRNNSGALKDKDGRVVRFGLGHVSKDQNENFKSSDLIGITPVVITPEMVGKTIGVFTAFEIKEEVWKFKGDKRETGQKNFIEWVKSKGGIAAFLNSVDQIKSLLTI